MTTDHEQEVSRTDWLAEYDGTDVTVDIAVARALEEVGVPVDEWRLRETLDPDALNRLFPDTEPPTDGRVSFVVDAYRVVVHATGLVRVGRADVASSGLR
jgi:hypothetical protein